MPFSCPSALFCFGRTSFAFASTSIFLISPEQFSLPTPSQPHLSTVPVPTLPPPRYLWWPLRLPSPQTFNDTANDDEVSSVMSTVKVHKVTRQGEQSHLAGHCSYGRISGRQRREGCVVVV